VKFFRFTTTHAWLVGYVATAFLFTLLVHSVFSNGVTNGSFEYWVVVSEQLLFAPFLLLFKAFQSLLLSLMRVEYCVDNCGEAYYQKLEIAMYLSTYLSALFTVIFAYLVASCISFLRNAR